MVGYHHPMNLATPVVTLTPKAVETARNFLTSQPEHPDAVLRVAVRGGGCTGFVYQLALDTPQDGDLRWEQDGVMIAVPQEAVRYLQGSTLDYVESLQETGFKFDNPNATGGCGCGSSFRVDDQQGCDSELGVGELDGIYGYQA